jgi:TolB-like protein/class 3 adenylate cyclase/tetratricopeptide (TPR) repeat protein
MLKSAVQRRLAALLAADVVGYSRLIGQDESGTLRRLKELRRSLIDPAIKLHHGRIVKTTGDGILVEFPSAVEAVLCAVRVQRAAAKLEASLPADRRIVFRAGVHQGDVVVEDADLFGDGVNVAARLETISEPGGICVSSRVREDMVGRLDLPFDDCGEQHVKNIARPIRVYSLGREAIAGLPSTSGDQPYEESTLPGWLRVAAAPFLRLRSWPLLSLVALIALALAGIGGWLVVRNSTGGAAHAPGGPTVAVLAFDNLSGDPSQEFISEGISDELTTVLSRFDQLHVLARSTTFSYKGRSVDIQELGRRLNAQYVVEGSLRRVADQISVTAQLIDAGTGTHVWADTYERPTTSGSLLAIQDDIAERIGASIGDIRTGAVGKIDLERSRGKEPTALSAYECVLQGYEASAAQSDTQSMRRARTCLEATVRRDPGYAEAWAILTRVLYLQYSWGTGLDGDRAADLLPRIKEAGTRAGELAPESQAAHFALFFSYAVTCQRERMRIETDRVLAINPNDANALGLLGSLVAYAGDWDYGRPLAEKAIALAGPAAPSWWWWVVAKDYYRKGDYSKALEVFRRSYSERNWLDHLHLVYTLPHLGRIEEARAEVPGLMKLKPDITVSAADGYYKRWCFDADFRARMIDAMRKAGLQE